MSTAQEARLVVDLVPRSNVNQLDLAVRWIGRNLNVVYRRTVPVACAAALLAYGLVASLELDLRVIVLVLAGLTWPLGLELGRIAASEAFDRRLEGSGILRTAIPAFVNRLAFWSGPCLVLYPLHWTMFAGGLLLHLTVGSHWGLSGSFAAEDRVLDARSSGRSRQRTRELVRQERSALFTRAHAWVAFWVGLTVLLAVGADQILASTFQRSFFIGHVTGLFQDYGFEEGLSRSAGYLGSAPAVSAVVAFWATLAYPFVRIAWMLGYVDLRIRRDLWDLHRRFHDEASRLSARTD